MLSDGRFLLTRYENQASSFYYADASGTVTPIQTPVKGTYFGMAGDDRFFIGVYAKRPLTAAVQQPAEQYDIPTHVLLDENMKVIRDDIDGACGAVSTPHFTNGLMPIQTGSILWIGSRKGAIGNGTYGLIDKTGQFVGRHDFDRLSWADSRYIGKRGTAPYHLDGKGDEIQLPVNASQESSWAKAELETAREHDISLSFYYPRLNITRVDFCRLAVKLYRKVQPNASAAPAAAFSDCENESVCLAAALGIVTGYDDGTFRPYQSITRQEAAAMLDRLYTTLGGKASAANDKPYADDTQLGDWARSSVYAIREIGIMQGKENNRFRLKDGYTQEQAVAITSATSMRYRILNILFRMFSLSSEILIFVFYDFENGGGEFYEKKACYTVVSNFLQCILCYAAVYHLPFCSMRQYRRANSCYLSKNNLLYR